MKRFQIPSDDPSTQELADLAIRAERAKKSLLSDNSEVHHPVFIEFAGSPKSGKSTIIGIVSHFFKRHGFRVGQPAEGASLRTPPDLKKDLLAFNAWSACYALQTILEDCHSGDPDHLVILDRGLFDAVVWAQFLYEPNHRITDDDRKLMQGFFTLDLWRQRESAVFLFTADQTTSLARETHSKLTLKGGGAMNADFLNNLLKAYTRAADEWEAEFPHILHFDTSFDVKGISPPFARIAMMVVEQIIEQIETSTMQQLLVTEPIHEAGFITDPRMLAITLERVVQHPQFMDREQAEQTTSVQQIVPYGLLKNREGRILTLRRRVRGEREELAGKRTFLVGGHAEKKDWDAGEPSGVFERCLRREVSEELIGVNVESMRRIGIINDVRNRVGNKHMAVIFEAEVGGSAGVRRQTVDREFGRESAEWKSPEEICQEMADLDPWSQLVAAKLFDAIIPDSAGGPTLFVNQ